MNKERQLTPMTKEEEYRNADVPMPEDEFKKAKEAADNEQDYQGGGAYRAFLNLFYKNKKDENDKK
jgi:hypothetical protein